MSGIFWLSVEDTTLRAANIVKGGKLLGFGTENWN